DSIDLLFNLVNKLHDFFDAIGGYFDFDNGGENLFPEYILAKSASRDIAHKQGERIFLFERHVRCSQRLGHSLNVAEPDTNAGTTKLDGETDFAVLHAIGDVVGFNFLGAAALNSSRFMGGARI